MSSSASSKNSPCSTEKSTQPSSEAAEAPYSVGLPGAENPHPKGHLDTHALTPSIKQALEGTSTGLTNWLPAPKGPIQTSEYGPSSSRNSFIPTVGAPRSVMDGFGNLQLPQVSFEPAQIGGMNRPFTQQTPKMDLRFLDALRYPSPIQNPIQQNHRPVLGARYGSSTQMTRYDSLIQKQGKDFGRYSAAPLVNSFGGKIKSPSRAPFGKLGVKQMVGVPAASPQEVYWHYNPGPDIYSRKVFVGGLPIDIDEDEINATFSRFGPVVVDWPHKSQNKAYFPPKGYVFLIFEYEPSVQSVVQNCHEENDKYYICVSSPTMRDKPVQVRPWRLADADFVVDANMPLDPRRTIFIGGVPRPLKAVELATIMDKLFGGVCYAGIDTDPELKYPKGAGRVAFSNQQSYTAAIAARFVQLQHGDVDKRVEVKPYVLDDQMCNECHGVNCNGKYAPFFCANVSCLQYFCESCWVIIHSRQGREYHKPMIKESVDRSPRGMGSRASTGGWQESVYTGPKTYYQ